MNLGKFKKAGISGSVWNVIRVLPRLIINIRLASKSIPGKSFGETFAKYCVYYT
jgi:hypothetical protein